MPNPKSLAGLSVGIALAFNSPALAQEAPARHHGEQEQRFSADFHAYVEQVVEAAPEQAGLSAAVVHDGRVIASVDFGMADREAGIPVSPETRWYIASSTKAFVGAALALLDQRGEIDLDWTLAELAPDVAFAPELRADEVTLRHLLSHSHGLQSNGIEFRLAYTGQHDEATLWSLLGMLQVNEDAPLGTFEYGNLGYNLATMLIERKTGRRWQNIVDREVTGPLEMAATVTQGLDHARAEARFAWPYHSTAPDGMRRLYLVKQDETMQSAGGMYSTVPDMAVWLARNLSSSRDTNPDEIAQALAISQQPIVETERAFGPFQRSGYALGWYVGDYQGGQLFHAFGSFVGAMAHASFMTDANLGVVATANDQGATAMAPHLIAAFAYDWFLLGPAEARAAGEERLADFSRRVASEREGLARQMVERAARQWQLSLPHAAYTGNYCDGERGQLVVRHEADDDTFTLQFGVMQAEAEPFTDPESLRVELIPGSGMAGIFQIEDGRVDRLSMIGGTFTRCD